MLFVILENMTKIIIAPDKFKGSLTGLQFCEAVEEGIRSVAPDVEIVKLPLADGGDGTVEALQFYAGGEIISLEVHDPLMRKIKASYLFAKEKKLAFIEMAEASGIRLMKPEELNPLKTTTFGTGELIADALENGAEHIILGIGGSATNDAGMGMARALGYRFLDEEGKELKGIGADLQDLKSIDNSKINSRIRNTKFEIACDVDNPLFGPNGAAFVYGPQKGADLEMVERLDSGLQNFNEVAKQQFDIDLQKIAGSGAAGGLGAGGVLFLNAQLKSGISLVKDVAGFDEKIKDADWIITGEGKLDSQTFSGKVIKGVINSRTNQKLAVLCGFSEIDPSDYKKYGINFLAETMPLAKSREDSMENACEYLKQISSHFAEKHL
jgi:glycerate kinase